MEIIRRIELGQEPGKFKFSRDGSRLLVMGRDYLASYDLNGIAMGAPIQTLVVFDAAYVNNEQIVTVGFADSREFCLTVYDIKTQRVLSQLVVDDTRAVCVDQHERIFTGRLNGANGGGYISVFDAGLTLQNQFETPYLYMPFQVGVSHSGEKLIAAGVAFGIWDISTEPKLISEPCPLESDCTGTPCEVNSGDITPDGRFAVAGFHGAKGTFAVLDGSSGKIIDWYGPQGDEWEYYAVSVLSISPDGKYVAVALDGSSKIKFYRVSDGSVAEVYDSDEYGYFAFSPLGNVFAVGDETSITLLRFAE
jgi:WD40 repeat protein